MRWAASAFFTNVIIFSNNPFFKVFEGVRLQELRGTPALGNNLTLPPLGYGLDVALSTDLSTKGLGSFADSPVGLPFRPPRLDMIGPTKRVALAVEQRRLRRYGTESFLICPIFLQGFAILVRIDRDSCTAEQVQARDRRAVMAANGRRAASRITIAAR